MSGKAEISVQNHKNPTAKAAGDESINQLT